MLARFERALGAFEGALTEVAQGTGNPNTGPDDPTFPPWIWPIAACSALPFFSLGQNLLAIDAVDEEADAGRLRHTAGAARESE